MNSIGFIESTGGLEIHVATAHYSKYKWKHMKVY